MHYGLKQDPVQIQVISPEQPINNYLEHFEAVVSRARFNSVMVLKPAIKGGNGWNSVQGRFSHCLELFECEDINGHPDEQKSPTSWYAMPLWGRTPRSTTG
ncbi:Hypothetical predicted protein [Mytilus galloprovincialis]|uniref:Uncharacterized protein n=1 Tax=Mytilus galloprovincialis TaxID=29158 RepID=A0A8B6GWF6_MYTGA|nr:Hypothetical predicted protein [Mytilus galloprovincialis]